MKRNVLVIGFVFCSQLLLAQPEISSIALPPVDYCREPVEFGERIRIEGDAVEDGLKVSISNYIQGEDQLSLVETTNISGRWDSELGTLFLTGAATAAAYEEAIQRIVYTNLADSPTNGTRSIAITLQDADYLPATGHFYQYISSPGISWTDAKLAAEAKRYHNLKGYLATIKSKSENDFIWTKVQGVGWIGASDAQKEGDWRWVTGPAADRTLFWRGNYNGAPVNGEYSFWSSGEPNNLGDEDYAHINQNPAYKDKSWNDLPDGGGDGYYFPQGYIVEFGGMEGDPEISLSATLEINVWNIQFDTDTVKTICKNEEVRLNQEFIGSYEWFPKTGLDDPNSSNPIARPMETTVYKVVSRNGVCADSAYFRVIVNPVPVVDFEGDRHICMGDSTELDAGSHALYEWNTGFDQQAFFTSEAGVYQVRGENEFACSTTEEVKVTVHAYPEIDLTDTDTLFCDSKTAEITVDLDKGQLAWQPLTSALDFSVNNTPAQANVTDWGTYKTYLTVTDQYGCVTKDSLDLSFYKTPTTDFSIDESECYGYNLDVVYTGDGTLDANYSWFFLDSIYAKGIGLTEVAVALGFDRGDNRKLGLMVNEGGCLSDTLWEHIKVIPNIEISVVDDEGCEPFLAEFLAETSEPVSEFIWFFGDGGVSQVQAPDYTYTGDGFYDVGLRIVSEEGCENFGLIEDFIKVRPEPTVQTNLDPDSCFPHQFEVRYTGTANSQDTYHWDLSALGAEEVLQDPGKGQGPFLLKLIQPQASLGLQITTEFGCESELRNFTFRRKPWVELSADVLEGCSPLEVNFQAMPVDAVDELNYSWNFDQGEGAVSGSAELANTFQTADQQFSVFAIARSSLTGCEDTTWLQAPIRVYPKPFAAFSANPNEVSIVEPLVHFKNESEAAQRYAWYFGDNAGTSAEFEPAYSYSGLGWFEVELIAENEFLCTDTATQKLVVAPDRIFAPNAFSPNSSSVENQVFLLKHVGVEEAGYHMQIFNRWGERIFEAKDEFVGWDGTMKNGQAAPTGVYTWVLAYQDFVGKSHRQTGTVTLVY
ncbi:PKD domain-containing protein [Sunxiuqinia rutila]|uniref:PKD domain-containing protein n=1 Tax=Sunxiuqinia rutila TaxID=1397841 RepID=UPI003D360EB6